MELLDIYCFGIIFYPPYFLTNPLQNLKFPPKILGLGGDVPPTLEILVEALVIDYQCVKFVITTSLVIENWFKLTYQF